MFKNKILVNQTSLKKKCVCLNCAINDCKEITRERYMLIKLFSVVVVVVDKYLKIAKTKRIIK